MKRYKHLFFDLDRTLWDFESNSGATLEHLFREFALQRLGIHEFEVFRQRYEYHNERFWERFRKGYMRRDDLRWKRMWHTLLDFKVADAGFALELSKVYLELLPQQGRLMPHAKEVLEYCRKNDYKLHLITNGFENTQWQKMRTSGIDHYFDQVITSEGSNSMKPKPGIFAYAVQAAGATAQTSVMIGDSLEADIQGARLYGMDQIYFNPGRTQHKYNCTYEIDCLSKLKTLL